MTVQKGNETTCIGFDCGDHAGCLVHEGRPQCFCVTNAPGPEFWPRPDEYGNCNKALMKNHDSAPDNRSSSGLILGNTDSGSCHLLVSNKWDW